MSYLKKVRLNMDCLNFLVTYVLVDVIFGETKYKIMFFKNEI